MRLIVSKIVGHCCPWSLIKIQIKKSSLKLCSEVTSLNPFLQREFEYLINCLVMRCTIEERVR